eukprot:m.239728 g.239728  ORF g.239728 m.239728 type:complete len:191 (-) comp16072_c0_seq4:2713-3285(-)
MAYFVACAVAALSLHSCSDQDNCVANFNALKAAMPFGGMTTAVACKNADFANNCPVMCGSCDEDGNNIGPARVSKLCSKAASFDLDPCMYFKISSYIFIIQSTLVVGRVNVETGQIAVQVKYKEKQRCQMAVLTIFQNLDAARFKTSIINNAVPRVKSMLVPQAPLLSQELKVQGLMTLRRMKRSLRVAK